MLYVQLSIVLLAFAANSLLCRWALDVHQFDPMLFSLIRLSSGAFILSILLYRFVPANSEVNLVPWREGHFWKLGAALAIYAVGFSWAYLQLDTGVGAFILFATIQIVIQFAAFVLGVRLSLVQRAGVIISLAGLCWLLLPNSAAPDLFSAGLMLVAASGWSWFVMLGKQSQRPLQDVQQAFVAASVITLLLSPLLLQDWSHWHWIPWVLALVSGVVASGLGYFLWYRILPRLGLSKAAQFQLLVPVIALLMGMIFLGETLSQHALGAMVLITTGVALSTVFHRTSLR